MLLKLRWEGNIVPNQQPVWWGEIKISKNPGNGEMEATLVLFGNMPEKPEKRTLQLAGQILLAQGLPDDLPTGFRISLPKQLSSATGWRLSTRWNKTQGKQITTWKQEKLEPLKTFDHVDWWNHIQPEEATELLKYSNLRYKNGPMVGQLLVTKQLVTVKDIQRTCTQLSNLPHELRKDLIRTLESIQYWEKPRTGRPNWLKTAFEDVVVDAETPIREITIWLLETIRRQSGYMGKKPNKTQKARRDQALQQIRNLLYKATKQDKTPGGDKNPSLLLETLKETITPELWEIPSKTCIMGIPSWFARWNRNPTFITVFNWVGNSNLLEISQEKTEIAKHLQKTRLPKKKESFATQKLQKIAAAGMLPRHWLDSKDGLDMLHAQILADNLTMEDLATNPETFAEITGKKHPLAKMAAQYAANQI